MPNSLIIDNTKEFVLNNEPIEEKLHVIAVVSNPCNFKIRYKLTQEFMKRMEKEPNVIAYLVELVYGNQPFGVTEAGNKRHLQIRTDCHPLWHKENMINLGVKYLLPADWKAVAWVDADVEFESSHWALDALKILNGGNDFIQLFTHCIDMDFNKQIMNTFTSFGYQYSKNFEKGTGQKYWHPGFAWACNRKTYNKTGGIYDVGILGSGDNIMCHTFIKKAPDSLKKGMSQEYIDYVANFQHKMEGVKLGYVPGPIRHYFHGKKENRNYYGREDILIKYQFNPYTFIKYDDTGVIIPTESFPKEFLKDIMDYFSNRNEDEMVIEEIMTKDKNNKDVLEYKINFILHEFDKLVKRIGVSEDDVKKSTKEIASILSLNTNNTGDVPEIVPVIIKNNKLGKEFNISDFLFKKIQTNYSKPLVSAPEKNNLGIINNPGIKYKQEPIKTQPPNNVYNILQNRYFQQQSTIQQPINQQPPKINNEIRLNAIHNTFKRMSFK